MAHRIEAGQEYAFCAGWPDDIRIRIKGRVVPGAYGGGKVRVVTLTIDGREQRPRYIGIHLLHDSDTGRGGKRRRTGYYLVKDTGEPAPSPPAPGEPSAQVNQIWADNDPRGYGRQVRIVAIDDTHASVELYRPRHPVSSAKPGRRTRILLSRFRPTSTGYRLVQHADGTSAATTNGSNR